MKALDSIAGLLHQQYGFDASFPGPDRLRRVVSERRAVTETRTEEEYFFLLENSRDEREALLETIIVPETYFFRHREAFAALIDWARSRGRFPVRVLSAACSTGEEAYSIVMALLDAGFLPEQFHVEACDVSPASLAHARRGVYTGKAFRSDDQSWRERYFTEVSDGWKISEGVCKLVHFRLGNLLALESAGQWDAVFCRNVMIYFSKAQQHHVVAKLRSILSDDGLLFLGPAEPPLFLSNGWSSYGYSMSFACLKQQDIPPKDGKKPTRQQILPVPRKKTPVAVAPVKAPPLPVFEEAKPEPLNDSLQAARQLADEGRLPEAEAALAELCKVQPQNAEAYFLRGVVAETQDRLELAETHYRKALYLAPGHAETLRHMGLLLRRQGRRQAAENLLRRAGRHTLTE